MVFLADRITLRKWFFFLVWRNKANCWSIPSHWFLEKSKNGWIKSDTFYEYIANGLNKWLVGNKVTKSIFLLIGRHKFYLSIKLMQFCHWNNVSVFKLLKTIWKKTIRKWQARPKNVNCVITKCTFSLLLQQVLQGKSLSKTIKNNFRKCGLFFFSVETVDYSNCFQNRLAKHHCKWKKNFNIIKPQLKTAKTVLVNLKNKTYRREIENIQL